MADDHQNDTTRAFNAGQPVEHPAAVRNEDTVTVASRAHTAIRIQEPMPEEFRDRPGEAPVPKTAVINGANHADAKGGVGFTHNVNAALFKAWMQAREKAGDVLHHMLEVVSPEQAEKDDAVEFGFQPGLDRVAKDTEGDAAKGSTVTHEAPVSAKEMAATSDTPPDDSPRSEPPAAAGMVAEPVAPVEPGAIPPAPGALAEPGVVPPVSEEHHG